MENESYKKLYYHAFNRLTDLAKEIERTQNELEEMCLRSCPFVVTHKTPPTQAYLPAQGAFLYLLSDVGRAYTAPKRSLGHRASTARPRI